ncbi:MAG: translocation/assembly module TamB domain-containing protein [Methylobacter sp.]|nr:translocation/assembly module TamB domain-containing protein [Methylobacter sp.]
MRKRIILIVLLIILIIPAGLLALISSETGSRWLLRQVFAHLPAQVSVETIEGRLINHVLLKNIHYQTDAQIIDIKALTFTWQPSELFSGALKIIELGLQGLTVNIPETQKQQTSEFNPEAELGLPVQVVLENFLLTDMQLHTGKEVYKLEKLHLSAAAKDGRLKIVSLTANAQPLAASLQGEVTLGKGFPFNLTMNWQLNAKENGLWQGLTTVKGNIHKLAFDNHLSSPFQLILKGNLDNLQKNPRIAARGDWQNIKWPITGAAPQLKSEQGYLELSGLLSDYKIILNGQLTQQYLHKASLSFNGKGGQEAMTIEKLELKSTDGIFNINGDVSWKDSPAFDLTAKGQNFNPAILLPEIPGNLTFSSQLKGKLAENALQLDAGIDHLSGKLRGYPVSANGKLGLTGDQLKVDALHVTSGINKLAANGMLSQKQGVLDVSIDAPNLASLWPNLGGALAGNGHLQGAWKNPAIKFQAKGNHLHFAEYSAGQLAINIDYNPDNQKISTINLSANSIKSGETQLTKLLVDGSGTLKQHTVKADINSSYGVVSAALTGGVKADTWQGGLSRLNLTTRDWGVWQLNKNMGLRITQKPSGIDAALDEGCLIQQAASLCTQGHYFANADFQFDLKATALPMALVQPYLPQQVKLQGIINADAELRNKNRLLAGHYNLDIPANAKIIVLTKDVTTTIPLGASSLSGKINGEIVSADFNLALAATDYVRGQLQVDTGEAQAIAGQITASVVEFAPLNALFPELPGIQGHLTSDLSVQGTINKPVIKGAIHLAAAVQVPEFGLDLHEIKLDAVAPADNTGLIELTGSAKSGEGFVMLNGHVLLQSESGWPVELRLTGENFEIAKLPEAQIAVSPALKLEFADAHGQVTGKLKVPKAIMQLKQLPENAVKVSQDEIIIGQEQTEENVPAAPGTDADIEIELGEKISFTGQGLKTNLKGKLKVIKTGEKIIMYGNVEMKDATYKSYGQDLTVRKGRFVFNGPVDNPWLDVEAIRVSSDKTVTAILSLTGPLNSPKTSISSDPALPESEALAYLITGKPLSQVSQSEGNMVASAALSYGAGQVSWLAGKFGVDQFEVEQGKTLQDTLLAVGRQLTPDFYVGAKVGLFNKQALLILKRKLTKSLNVETQTGESQRIKLNYELDTD